MECSWFEEEWVIKRMFSVKAFFKLVQYTVDVFAVFVFMIENFIHISKG